MVKMIFFEYLAKGPMYGVKANIYVMDYMNDVLSLGICQNSAKPLKLTILLSRERDSFSDEVSIQRVS